MENVFAFVGIFICFLEAYLMIDFFMAFFPLREVLQRKYTKIAAVVMTAVCVRVVNSFNSSTFNIIAMQVIYLSLLFGMYSGKVLRKIFCYLVGIAIMIGSEFLWIVVMSAPSDFKMNQLQNSSISIYMTLLGAKTLAFLFFTFTKRVAKSSGSKMDLKSLLLFSVVPIATLGLMVSLAYLRIDFDSIRFVQILLIVCSILIVIGNILIFNVFDEYVSSTEKLQKQELRIAKMEMEEKRYAQIETVNQEHAGFLHDIRHYLRTIASMANENRDQEILDVLTELQIKVSDAELEIYCPNRLLNTILNEKKKTAKERGIYFKLSVEPDFNIEHIENMDLIVIMGNLLDNAIEAAEKCRNGYLKIFLYAENNAHFSIIKIVNNYMGNIEAKDGVILTTKGDKSKHGFGIQNINATAEKYNGYLQSFYEDGVFTSVVIIPMVNDQ